MSAVVRLVVGTLATVLVIFPISNFAISHADTGAVGAPGIGGEPGINPGVTPATASVLLCSGVGQGVVIVGGGGGWCDFNFIQVGEADGHPLVMHTHCEGGGFQPIVSTWQCWRVFPGQPDHPRLTDPDIVPDGWSVPWALTGPAPNDQWPPPGLAPVPPPPPAPFMPPWAPGSPPPPPPEPPPPIAPWDQPLQAGAAR